MRSNSISPEWSNDRKSNLLLAIVFALGTLGVASAGMQGQGPKPDAPVSEKKEAEKKGMSSEAEIKAMERGEEGRNAFQSAPGKGH